MDEIELDKYHYHEFLDRTHLVQDIFESHLAEHPVAVHFKDEIAAISERLMNLYQKAAVLDMSN